MGAVEAARGEDPFFSFVRGDTGGDSQSAIVLSFFLFLIVDFRIVFLFFFSAMMRRSENTSQLRKV